MLLLSPLCESISYTSVNGTTLSVQGITDSTELSVTFRTCSPGVVLSEDRNNLTVSIIKGSLTQHSYLRLTWSKNNQEHVLNIQHLLSVDVNVGIQLEISLKLSGSTVVITNTDLPEPKDYKTDAAGLNGLIFGNVMLGSDSFVGCFASDSNTKIITAGGNCSLADLKECSSKPGKLLVERLSALIELSRLPASRLDLDLS